MVSRAHSGDPVGLAICKRTAGARRPDASPRVGSASTLGPSIAYRRASLGLARGQAADPHPFRPPRSTGRLWRNDACPPPPFLHRSRRAAIYRPVRVRAVSRALANSRGAAPASRTLSFSGPPSASHAPTRVCTSLWSSQRPCRANSVWLCLCVRMLMFKSKCMSVLMCLDAWHTLVHRSCAVVSQCQRREHAGVRQGHLRQVPFA